MATSNKGWLTMAQIPACVLKANGTFLRWPACAPWPETADTAPYLQYWTLKSRAVSVLRMTRWYNYVLQGSQRSVWRTRWTMEGASEAAALDIIAACNTFGNYAPDPQGAACTVNEVSAENMGAGGGWRVNWTVHTVGAWSAWG